MLKRPRIIVGLAFLIFALAASAQQMAVSVPAQPQNINFTLTKVFIFLFLTLGPLKLLGPFAQMTRGCDAAARRNLAFRATVISIVAIVCYLLASALLARPLFGGGKTTLSRPALGIATVAVLAHAAGLLVMHRGALDLHFFAALSLVACLVSALTLLVNLTRPVATLGVIVFPLSALLLGVDSFLAPSTARTSRLH